MTRLSKQARRRLVSPKRRQAPAAKTGPKKDVLAKGYREHPNALAGDLAKSVFIAKVK